MTVVVPGPHSLAGAAAGAGGGGAGGAALPGGGAPDSLLLPGPSLRLLRRRGGQLPVLSRLPERPQVVFPLPQPDTFQPGLLSALNFHRGT